MLNKNSTSLLQPQTAQKIEEPTRYVSGMDLLAQTVQKKQRLQNMAYSSKATAYDSFMHNAFARPKRYI